MLARFPAICAANIHQFALSALINSLSQVDLPQTTAVDALVRAHAITLNHPIAKATGARYLGELTI